MYCLLGPDEKPVEMTRKLCIRALVIGQQNVIGILRVPGYLRSIGTDTPVSLGFRKGFFLTLEGFCP